MTIRDLLEDSCERVLSAHVDPKSLAAAEYGGAFANDLWRDLGEGGFLHALTSGDAGVGWADAYPIFLAAGRHGAPVPITDTIAANWVLDQAGLEASHEPVGLASGRLEIRQGRAVGRLSAVAWGRRSPRVIALEAGPEPRLLVLRAADLGLTPGENIAREPRDSFAVEGVVPEAIAELPRALGEDVILRVGALIRSAQMAGALARALDLSITYAEDRKQFGRSISGFQAIQHQLAVLAEQASLCAVAADAAFLLAGPALAEGPIAAAKVVAGEAAQEGCAIAHAVHGAIGVTFEHALRFTTNRLWSWRDEFGSERRWAERIGRAAAAAGPSAWWSNLVAPPTSLAAVRPNGAATPVQRR